MSAFLETPSRIEPCFLEGDIPRLIADLVVDIHAASADLGKSLHPDSAAELAEFVRVMNCYYSNLIEGHDTRPKDCPSSDDLRRVWKLRNGGSGPSGLRG